MGIIDSAGFRRRVISEAEVNISTQIETGFGLYRVVQWDEFAERASYLETTVKLERILETTWLRMFVIGRVFLAQDRAEDRSAIQQIHGWHDTYFEIELAELSA